MQFLAFSSKVTCYTIKPPRLDHDYFHHSFRFSIFRRLHHRQELRKKKKSDTTADHNLTAAFARGRNSICVITVVGTLNVTCPEPYCWVQCLGPGSQRLAGMYSLSQTANLRVSAKVAWCACFHCHYDSNYNILSLCVRAYVCV